MQDYTDRKPAQLSGGQQQRVAIARALVTSPAVLLADEPTGNLDEENKAHILTIFKEANIRGTTVVVATHDRHLIGNGHKRVIMLEKGHILDESDVSQ